MRYIFRILQAIQNYAGASRLNCILADSKTTHKKAGRLPILKVRNMYFSEYIQQCIQTSLCTDMGFEVTGHKCGKQNHS